MTGARPMLASRISRLGVATETRAREGNALLHRNEREEEPVQDARPQAGVPLSGEHRDHRPKDGARRFRIEEEVAELRRVEANHEAAEGLVAPPLPFGEGGELPRGKVVPRQRAVERLG